MFAPLTYSWLGHLLSLITGDRAEYQDPKWVCKSEGRQITRVISNGRVEVQFNILAQGMSKFGYTEDSGPTSTKL
jgi:B9 domain-containing protein 1